MMSVIVTPLTLRNSVISSTIPDFHGSSMCTARTNGTSGEVAQYGPLRSFVVCLAGTTERCSMSGQTFLMTSLIFCASALETRNIWEYRPPSLTERDSLTSPPVLQIALCATEKISPESTPPMCTST